MSPINNLPSWLGFLSCVTAWTCIYMMPFSTEHQCWYFMERGRWTNEKLVRIFVPKTGGVVCDVCLTSAWRKKLIGRGGVKKKEKSTCFQFIFKFSPLYNSITYGFFFSSHKNISNFSNLFFIILFILRVRVCCVRIPVMVRFIIANIRGYRCRSAGLRVGWFLHCFCEVQLHLIEKKKRTFYPIEH